MQTGKGVIASLQAQLSAPIDVEFAEDLDQVLATLGLDQARATLGLGKRFGGLLGIAAPLDRVFIEVAVHDNALSCGDMPVEAQPQLHGRVHVLVLIEKLLPPQ